MKKRKRITALSLARKCLQKVRFEGMQENYFIYAWLAGYRAAKRRGSR